MSVATYLEEVGQLGLTRAPPDVRGMIRGPNGRPRADLGLGGLLAARQATARNAWEAAAVRPDAARPKAAAGAGVRPVGYPPQPPVVVASPPPVAVAAPPPVAAAVSGSITDALADALGSASSRLEAVDQRLATVDQRLEGQDASLTAASTKLDSLSLWIGTQDTGLKSLRQSVTALRTEYSQISQATDGQSAARLDAIERSVSQLSASFQAFSARVERDIEQMERRIEQLQALPELQSIAGDEPSPDALYRAAVVLDARCGLPPLTPILVRGEARAGVDGNVYLKRQSYDPQQGLVDVDVLAEFADGAPGIAFV